MELTKLVDFFSSNRDGQLCKSVNELTRDATNEGKGAVKRGIMGLVDEATAR